MLERLEQARQQFKPDLLRVREQLRFCDEKVEVARLRGEISGIYRRYRTELLIVVTTWSIAETPTARPTKFLVAKWQMKVFGRSLANGRLAEFWCDPERSSGERGFLQIRRATAELAALGYSTFANALENEPPRQQLDLLAEALLARDLGL
jgi:hypothetical protein